MTTPTTSLDLLLVSPMAGIPTGDDVWLRMEQILDDDLVTHGEIAELVDELYQVDPCLPPVEAEAAKDTFNTLPAGASIDELLTLVARKFDLAECDRRKNGDYTARVKIIRSHLLPYQENQYTLVPSVGQVTGIRPIRERVTLTIPVKGKNYVVLDYPVLHLIEEEWPGTVTWMGATWTDDRGSISPPGFRCSGRVISWGIPCNGTLLVNVDTYYDIATVDIPGRPGAAIGTADAVQECTLRAFYRFQVYEFEIVAVNTDPTANQSDLATICGWSDVGGGGVVDGVGDSDGDGDDDGDDADDGNDGPQLGCLEPAQQLADPEFYRETCCKPPPFGLPNCAAYATDRGQVEPSQAEKDRQAAEARGRVSYVAVGPGPDGCGRKIVHQAVNRRNCCGDVTPMSPDPENPIMLAPLESASFKVLDGRDYTESGELWEWQTSGGLVLHGGGTAALGGREMLVHAPAEWCESGTIRVDDGCTTLTMRVGNSSPPEPLAIFGDDHTVSPGGYLSLTAVGGVPPYAWMGSDSLTLISAESANPATFQASESFCGSEPVRVSDACADHTETIVRSTAGVWVEVDDFDPCSPPMVGSYPSPDGYGVSIVGQYKVVVSRLTDGWKAGTSCAFTLFPPPACEPGNQITATYYAWSKGICDYFAERATPPESFDYDDGCCLWDYGYGDPGPDAYLTTGELVTALWEWRCHE